MHVAEVGTSPRHRAPFPGGPEVEMLLGPGASEQVAVIHATLPAGSSMPEHDHGASQVVVIPLAGSVELRRGEERRELRLGSAGHVATGERVSLANPGTEPASLIIVVSPPDFAAGFAAWPTA